MDQDAFWELVDRSREHSPSPEARVAWLQDALARRPLADVAGFQICQDRTRLRSDTYALWGPAPQRPRPLPADRPRIMRGQRTASASSGVCSVSCVAVQVPSNRSASSDGDPGSGA